MRILLIAEAANPEVPSIPLVGWSHARAIAELTDTHMVTQIRTRDAILRAGLKEGLDFTAIDSSNVGERVFRIGEFFRGGTGKQWTIFSAKGWATHTAFSTLSYYYFEYLLWKEFGSRIRAGEFDLVHRLLPLSPVVPSLIAKKCRKAGVPFVLGPINGGVPWPEGFDEIHKKEREWISYFRPLHKIIPGFRSTKENAAAIIVGSRFTLEQIPNRYRDKCVYIPENGINTDKFQAAADRPVGLPLRVAFVGRLVPLKGVDMLLEAVTPLVRRNLLVLDIIGDGPEMPRLQELVKRAGIGFGVTMDGWVEHANLQQRLGQSDVFGFPSIRDFGGGVLVEAMALGLVPVVLDYAGPGELVTPDTGFLVPMGNREEVIAGLRKMFEVLVDDPSPIRQMRRHACRRVQHCFTWKAKALQTLRVYEWVLGQRTSKPDFGIPLRS